MRRRLALRMAGATHHGNSTPVCYLSTTIVVRLLAGSGREPCETCRSKDFSLDVRQRRPKKGAIMPESTITAKGQTTLPKDVRAALGLRPGDRVRYLILDGGEVRLLRSRPVMGLAGLLRDHITRTVSLEEMDAAIAEAARGE